MVVSPWKILGLGKFWSNLKILEAFVVSLKVLKLLFCHKSLIFRTNLFKTMAMAYSGTIFLDTAIYILWFNFILGSNFVFSLPFIPISGCLTYCHRSKLGLG